jgi:hypothetical protein
MAEGLMLTQSERKPRVVLSYLAVLWLNPSFWALVLTWTGVKTCLLTISDGERIPARGSLVIRPGEIVVTRLTALSCERFSELYPFTLKTEGRELTQRHLEA